jgi:hypothetical protein
MRTDPEAVQRRRYRSRNRKEPRSELANDLLLGAEAVAQFIYGKVTTKSLRDTYRNVLELPYFKHGNTIAALKSALIAEIKKKQQQATEKAQEERRRKAAEKARRTVKPRRRIHPRREQAQTAEAA